MPLKKRKTIKELTDIDYKERNKLTESQLRSYIEDAIFYETNRIAAVSKAYLRRNNDFPLPIAYSENHSRKLYEGETEKEIDKARKNVYKSRIHEVQSIEQGDVIELRRLFKEYQTFLQSETSTLKGWENTMKKAMNTIEEQSGVRIKKGDYEYFWNVFNAMSQSTVMSFNSNYEVYRIIYDTMEQVDMTDFTPQELATYLENEISEQREQKGVKGNENNRAGLFPLERN